MRRVLIAAAAALSLGALAGCVPEAAGPPGHPNAIIIREFAFSAGVVTLDPSFGFSLYRGSPGVPARTRAASVGRGAAFSLADAIATQLASLGYDVLRSDTAAAEPGGRALIVAGAFRHIDEGRRRRVGAENPGVAIDGAIEFQAGAAAARRLTSFQLDSRQVADGGIIRATAPRGGSVNAAATRLGGAIARYVAEVARANNWPTAALR